MSNWAHVYDLKGKPVISTDKPGSLIEKVLDEIQARALIAIQGSNSGGGTTPVRITVERVDENTVKLSASVDIPTTDPQNVAIEIENNLSPYVILSYADGMLTVEGEGYSPKGHLHPEYSLGGAQNPREVPAGGLDYELLQWYNGHIVSGPLRAM